MKSIVVIPTYNEAANIAVTLDAIAEAAPFVDVLVVDDNSPDRTAQLVSDHDGFGDRIHLIVRADKTGLGSAYRAGFSWALNQGYEVIAQMDADLSHPPQRLPVLIEATRDADIAVGSRYVHGGAVSHWSLSRRLISRTGNRYVRLVLGLPVHDTTSGFKAFRSEALRSIGALTSQSNGYCFQIENTWRASQLGLRVVEVPIIFTDRTAGVSKMSNSIICEALWRVLVWRWHQLTERAPALPLPIEVRRDRHDVAA